MKQDAELLLAALVEGTVSPEQLSTILSDAEFLEIQLELMTAHLHTVMPNAPEHNCTVH